MGVPTVALHLGSAVHYALAEAMNGRDPIAAVNTFCRLEEERIQHAYRARVGTDMSPVEINLRIASRELAVGIVTHYFEHWGVMQPFADLGLWTIASEVSWQLPIPNSDGGVLTGTFDALAVDVRNRVWIIEHKTMTSPNTIENLVTDDQMTHYVWAARKLFKEPIAGVVYDGIAKKLPTVPKINKDGTVSRANITTTGKIYAQAVVDSGGQIKDYQDIIDRLSQGSQFFTRIPVTFEGVDWTEIERSLAGIYSEMSSDTVALYPNFQWQGCYDCWVKDLCTTRQFNGDVASLIAQKYVRGAGHRTVKATSRSLPRGVSSIYDFST